MGSGPRRLSQYLRGGTVKLSRMLPPDFRWIKPAATAYDETVIAHGDTWVVHIYQPERGRQWVAMLDAHREPEGRRHRRCTAFANGKTGAELWVQREQARLRLEVQQRLG